MIADNCTAHGEDIFVLVTPVLSLMTRWRSGGVISSGQSLCSAMSWRALSSAALASAS